MSKNTQFSNKKTSPTTDPVKDAQAQADAEAALTAGAEGQTGDEVQTDTAADAAVDALTPAPFVPQPVEAVEQTPVAAKEPEPAPAPKAAPVVVETKKAPVSNNFDALIGQERRKGTASAIALISFLDTYTDTMTPRRPITGEDVLRQQESLMFKLRDLVESAPITEFDRLWNIVVAYFSEFKNACFSPTYYARGIRDWKRSPEECTMFLNLMNLLHATASNRKTVKQEVDLQRSVAVGLTDEGRGRLVAFYQK